MSIHKSVELSHICPLAEIKAHAAALEANGFHRVWIPDTVVSPWEAWLAASLIVQHTTRLQIGLGVTNPYTRHPVVIAQMAATMQQYSGGRLTISLGKGIGRFLEKAGIKQHIKAVEECVHVLRGLLAGERTRFSGDVFKIDAMKLRTHSPDTPIPIYLAAVGSAGWNSAIRIADGITTFWNDRIAETRQQFMTDRSIPVAVLIPFSLSRTDFFESRVMSTEELRQRVAILEKTGFDEVIVAYGDMKDLEAAAQLLGANT